MPNRVGIFIVLLLATISDATAGSDRERLLADLEGYFLAETASDHRRRVVMIEANPAFKTGPGLSRDLHALPLFAQIQGVEHQAGYIPLEIDVGLGQTRHLTLRVPRGYDSTRPWPLIYALHPSGGNGPEYIRRVEQLLGKRIEEFIVAAPTHYRQTTIDAPPPFTPEHPVMLRELRRAVHLDADRIYALGMSLGGYTAWTLAILHADELAGAVPIASAFSPPADFAGLWQRLSPNLAYVPVLHVWGARDRLPVPGFEGRENSGTISSLNARFSRLIKELDLSLVNDHRVASAGHAHLEPPSKAFRKLLDGRRIHSPKQVRHTFRHLHQARAYWLEGHSWTGDHWGEPGRPIEPQSGESRQEAIGRVMSPLLGELKGTLDGQVLSVSRRHIREMTVWIGDDMIDWQQPVILKLDGQIVFSGRLKPDLGVCLAEAARRRDFDRLRWAGLRVHEDGSVEPLTPQSGFPSPR